jgi:hypothetical protein
MDQNGDILSKLLNAFNSEDIDLSTKLFLAVCIAMYFLIHSFVIMGMMMLQVYQFIMQ